MINLDKGLGSGGAFPWFFQRVTGAMLLIGLLAHFWVLHFFPAANGEITFQTVMARLQSPFWRTFDLLFLLAGVYHGMNGVMMNIHDYIHNPLLKMITVAALWMGALYLLIIGSITILGLS